MATGTGTLFVVATPIGNLDDISVRARAVLEAVDLIAAEDTRRTGRLLGSLGISGRMISCHEHNEQARLPELMALLESGRDIALVSDAGTPLLSDPGFRLVSEAAVCGYTITPIPGCSAAVAAASIAGLPTDSLLFLGFLPATAVKRQRRLEDLSVRTETLVFYESVHRVKAVIDDMALLLGPDRRAVAARELTKLHETIYRGTLAELQAQLAADPGANKGEYTLVIAGAPALPDDSAEALDRALQVLLGYLGVRQAAEAAAKILGVRKNDAYKRALEMRKSTDEQY